MNVYFVYKVLTNRIRALIRAAGYIARWGHHVHIHKSVTMQEITQETVQEIQVL